MASKGKTSTGIRKYLQRSTITGKVSATFINEFNFALEKKDSDPENFRKKAHTLLGLLRKNKSQTDFKEAISAIEVILQPLEDESGIDGVIGRAPPGTGTPRNLSSNGTSRKLVTTKETSSKPNKGQDTRSVKSTSSTDNKSKKNALFVEEKDVKRDLKSENLQAFLVELTSILAGEKDQFTDKVIEWFELEHKENIKGLSSLVKQILNQPSGRKDGRRRSERSKIQKELIDLKGQGFSRTDTENSRKIPDQKRNTTEKKEQNKQDADFVGTDLNMEKKKHEYFEEIEKLENEITDDSVDLLAFTKRNKHYQNDQTLMCLHSIRQRVSDSLDEKREIKETISAFRKCAKKRDFKKLSLPKGGELLADLEELLADLNLLCDEANSKMYPKIKEDIQKFENGLKDGKLKSDWIDKLRKDQDTARQALGRIAVKNAEWIQLEQQFDMLWRDIETGEVHSDKNKRTSSTKAEEQNFVSVVRQRMQDLHSKIEGITIEISRLKSGDFKKVDKEKDAHQKEQWETDLDEISLKISYMEKELKNGSKLRSEILQLKQEIDSKTRETSTNTSDNNEELTQFVVKTRSQISQWMIQQSELETFKRELESDRTMTSKNSHNARKDTKAGSSQTVTYIKERLQQSHSKFEDVTKDIASLRRQVCGDEEPKTNKTPDEKWKTDLDAIKGKVSTIKNELESVMSTHIEISTLNEEVDSMEGILTAAYKEYFDTKTNHYDTPRHTRTSQKPQDLFMNHLQIMVKRLESILANQRGIIEGHKKEIAELRRTIADTKDNMLQLNQFAEKLDGEKKELLLRLSSVAGAKLVQDNPNIADLSDPNRPTKLAEKYKELYDTEWTDAYEALDNGKKIKEKEICFQLLELLFEAEKTSSAMAEDQSKVIRRSLFNPTADDTINQEDFKDLDSPSLKLINDLRKQTAHKSVKAIVQVLAGNEKSNLHPNILKYKQKCIEICWYMSLQTPPVVLEQIPKEKSKFNKDKYAEYTKKGSHIDFVAWPPLLLHKDGALLCKGVAQGK